MPRSITVDRRKYTKKVYKKSVRLDAYVKDIIEKNFRDVCRQTGLQLSYGEIARAFWVSLAEHPRLRRECMELACNKIIRDRKEKALRHGSAEHR